MPAGQLAAVIFDLDGVITDTAEFHYRAWQRVADELGVPFDRERNEALRGLSRDASLRRLLAGRELPEARFADVLATKNRYYLDSLDEMGPGDVLDGAAELVRAVRDRGRAAAIGSSSRNATWVLDRLGVRELFDLVADGSSAPRAKPDPGIFLAAAAALEVEPGRCVVLEDAASGVDAALAGAMRAVGIGPPQRVGHADQCFASTAAVDLDAVLALPPLTGPRRR